MSIEESIIIRTAKREATEYNPRGSTKELLEVMADDGILLRAVGSSEDLTRDKIEVHEVKFINGGITISPEPIEVRLDLQMGILNRSTIPNEVQELHKNLPIANNNALREYADKGIQVEMFPNSFASTIGVQVKNSDLESLDPQTEEFLESLEGKVIVKPVAGMDGRGLYVVKNDPTQIMRVINLHNQQRAEKQKAPTDFIIQEEHPAQEVTGIKGKTSEDQELFEQMKRAIEIRAYCVGNELNQLLHFVGRAKSPPDAEEKVDEWIMLNQDTIPPELAAQAAFVFQELIKRTNSNIGIIAVDFYCFDGKFFIREINVRDPLIPKGGDHPINENIARAFREG